MRTRAVSWRPMTQPGDASFFRDYDAVIATSVTGRGRTYEVYTYGQLISMESSLEDAKHAVEMVYGPLDWTRRLMDPVEVTHYYYGPTKQFQDPLTIYYVEKLPSLL